MRVLVGGGAGYVGSVLVPRLLAAGHDVAVVDLLWFGNCLPAETEVRRRDLFTLTAADFEGWDCVVFLAGLSNDPMAEYDPAMSFVHNGALPSYLAYCAKTAGVPRFVYASSCSIYGFTEDAEYDESCPVTCGYPYGISKLQGERGVLQLCDETFSAVALRQGTVCGHSPRMRFDLIVNTMYKFAMTQGRITVNNPAIWRPLVDVRDAAAALQCAVEAPAGLSGVFNVACGNFTVGAIGAAVCEQLETLGAGPLEVVTKHIRDFRNYRVAYDKIQRELGFRPQYGLADMVTSLHEHRAQYGDFSDARFYNIETFRAVERDLRRPVTMLGGDAS